MEKDTDLIEIYRGNPVDSEIITDILNDNGIIASMNNQMMGSIAPWQVAAGGLDPVSVEIFARDKDKALELIHAFIKSNTGE
ncbi:DUF2007 domain-containing protein [Ancylomarina sp. DW003]|nr:DUF2007 domain-containing protein [Ancylomarina sp. DW003]MDE5421366.1 DUF2007 domain-containing protein [Ancylomarina sp. DW003]